MILNLTGKKATSSLIRSGVTEPKDKAAILAALKFDRTDEKVFQSRAEMLARLASNECSSQHCNAAIINYYTMPDSFVYCLDEELSRINLRLVFPIETSDDEIVFVDMDFAQTVLFTFAKR